MYADARTENIRPVGAGVRPAVRARHPRSDFVSSAAMANGYMA